MTKSKNKLPSWPLPLRVATLSQLASQLTDNLMMYFMYNNKYKGCSFQSVRGWHCERERDAASENRSHCGCMCVCVYVCAGNQYAQVQSLFDVHNEKE